MAMDELPITLAGKNKLEAELNQLVKVEREEIKIAIVMIAFILFYSFLFSAAQRPSTDFSARPAILIWFLYSWRVGLSMPFQAV